MRNVIFIILIAFIVSSCTSPGTRHGAKTLRNINQLVLATKDPNANVSPAEALSVIALVAEPAANLIDPKMDAPATVTVADMKRNKEQAFMKIVSEATTLPPTDWGWLATLGGGLLVGAGLLGKFMGPPYNLGGAVLETLGRRLVPKYEETKKAAVGMLVATDVVLTDYGDLLDTLPEVKKALADRLGQDPVKWFKSQLQKANTDNGTEPAVSSMLQLAKKHMTTEDGSLMAKSDELNKFTSKNFSNM